MIKFLHARRRKPDQSVSHFASTIERIRDMRGHSQWEPLTPPSSIHQRADRVAEAREHIKVPPLANERETGKTHGKYFKSEEFLRPVVYPVAVFLGVVALAVYVFRPEGKIESQLRQASFVFPGVTSADLTESDAERFARRSLASSGFDSSEWLNVTSHITNGATIITFRHQDERSTIVRVKVQLEPGERILCSIEPR
jgi:hypothetical protein